MNVLDILNLSPGDTLDEAKKQYRILALKYHPDKNPAKDAINKFREIQEAYKSICSNLTLLNPKKLEKSRGKGFIQIELSVTIEDIYFYREHIVCIDRLVVCVQCEGTGSKDGKKGLCEHCNGAGSIDNKIVKLMGTSSVCPVCKGSGKKEEGVCSKCKGNKYNTERKYYKVKVGLNDYHKGFKVLRGYGNEYEPGKFSDLHIRLKVFYDELLSIQDYKFVHNKFITPIQSIIGDEETIYIYGKKIVYKIIPGELDYIYTDERPGMPDRCIRFVYTEKKPRVIEETKILYEKINKIEKILGLIKEEE